MSEIFLHKEDRTVATLLARIKGEKIGRRKNDAQPMYDQAIPEPNCSKLLDFYRDLLTEELSLGRVAVLLGNMYRVSIWLNHRPFEELNRGDIIDLVAKIKGMRLKRITKRTVRKGYAEQTIESYKITLKKFWRWLKNPGLSPDELQDTEYPHEVSWIKRRKGKNGVLPKDIWTPGDINKLASLASNGRDRAFILGLFGSGCRIGEFLPLSRRDIVFDQYSCQILVDGKTGSRRVRLTPAASVALSAWLDIHPNKDPDAPIWINIQIRKEIPSQHLSYDWAHKMMKDLARRAGIEKPIRPHLLRHSLATHYAPQLTEAVMNEHFGWRQGGRTAAIYTHLSGKQVDDQILAACGQKRMDIHKSEPVEAVLCQRCGLQNTPSSVQCGKCGFALSEKAAMELCQRRQKADELMDLLLQHPEVINALKAAMSTRNAA